MASSLSGSSEVEETAKFEEKVVDDKGPSTEVEQSNSNEDDILVSRRGGASYVPGALELWEVTWSTDDRENPQTWSQTRKWWATLLLSCLTLTTIMSSTMIAPSLNSIQHDLDINSGAETQLALSVFVLAYAVAPMFLGPLSEILGRLVVLQAANVWFVIWTIVCGFANSKALLVVARFFSGVGGSAAFAVGAGFLGDCWDVKDRGKSVAILNLIPILGPFLGPFVGGYLTAALGWRWVFWIVAIFEGLVLLLASVCLRETHARTILYRRMRKLAKEKGNTALRTEWDTLGGNERTLRGTVCISCTRSFHMLATAPTIQIVTLHSSLLYGVEWLIYSSFAQVWISTYGQSESQSGLNYLSVVIGSIFASFIGGYISDRVWRILSHRACRPEGSLDPSEHCSEDGLSARPEIAGLPEYRIPMILPGLLLVPAGLLWYGWSAQNHLHWIMPNLGVIIFMLGIVSTGQCEVAYLVDSFQERASSAMAASNSVRSLLAFSFPLFAAKLYELGLGWGNSLLAFLSLAIGVPVAFVLWKYGVVLRERYRFE